MSPARYRVLSTPTGDFAIVEHTNGAIETGWINSNGFREKLHGKADPLLLEDLAQRLMRYFDGEPTSFGDVPLPPATPFMHACWRACRMIPRGETISYAELASRAGGPPSAARAAGQAMRRNPQPIITPCHRVIGSGGNLHGFAGTISRSSDALAVKRFLLHLERDGSTADSSGLLVAGR